MNKNYSKILVNISILIIINNTIFDNKKNINFFKISLLGKHIAKVGLNKEVRN